MKSRTIHSFVAFVTMLTMAAGCAGPATVVRSENRSTPAMYKNSSDTTTIADINWRTYFSDPNLTALIDTALRNNQELNIMLQEIEISKNEIRARKGEYLPFVGVGGRAAMEKEGRYTRFGAVDDNLEIKPGKAFPEPFSDFEAGAYAHWELDIWKKLRNAKKSATMRYLSGIEGRNFMVTNLVAEISSSYYELMALDNQLEIIKQNIDIQSSALEVIRQQKDAARVTQLAVNRFEAQLLNTKNRQFEIQQRIVETENRINFLTGRFPAPIPRNSALFTQLAVDSSGTGVPSQLLSRRPDIRQAEMDLQAAKIDVMVARANFYPSLSINAATGFNAFNPMYLVNPESMLFNLAGEIAAPLINRNAIKAAYSNANAKQLQAIYNYEKTILNAYCDVLNQRAKIENYSQSFQTKNQEVELLMQSVSISNSLFNSARADYMEVLLTQREALESKIDLIEIKMKQLDARINIYRSLGGGWR